MEYNKDLIKKFIIEVNKDNRIDIINDINYYEYHISVYFTIKNKYMVTANTYITRSQLERFIVDSRNKNIEYLLDD